MIHCVFTKFEVWSEGGGIERTAVSQVSIVKVDASRWQQNETFASAVDYL